MRQAITTDTGRDPVFHKIERAQVKFAAGQFLTAFHGFDNNSNQGVF